MAKKFLGVVLFMLVASTAQAKERYDLKLSYMTPYYSLERSLKERKFNKQLRVQNIVDDLRTGFSSDAPQVLKLTVVFYF